ncbi:hypothetical protein [Clostridium faecium]|uniref:CopG family transcriptional regulator n=1 Tax=Clostridium faecium TaxID=2762223 RepID=A0ABR8YRP4_9CLOT|nr:hypothetical protein [Clostridium faecium]MBD8046688.1 hypothetical protein [Clostridium faecium]
MADIINIRLTKECPEVSLMDETAKALGISRNEMIVRAITMMVNFDTTFYKKLEKYSDNVKVPMHLAIQNTIIKRWAQDNAKKAVWGTNRDLLLEFAYNEDGVVTTKELYEMIYKMTFEEETKERFRLLQEDVNHGIELRGEDKVFYDEFKPKYGYKPKMEKESLNDGSAFWEGEDDGEK